MGFGGFFVFNRNFFVFLQIFWCSTGIFSVLNWNLFWCLIGVFSVFHWNFFVCSTEGFFGVFLSLNHIILVFIFSA